MKKITPALLVILPAFNVQAQSLSFEGATISFERHDNRTYDYRQNQFEGSVELGFGAFSAQADLARWIFEPSGVYVSSLGLHAIYDIGVGTSAGVFFTREHAAADGRRYNFAGLEAKHRFSGGSLRPLTLEAYYGDYSQDDGAYNFEILSADLDWAFGSGVSLNGGVTRSRGDDVGTQMRIGVDYTLAQGPRVGLKMHWYDYDFFENEVFTLSLAYDLKGGTTFKQRHFANVIPGY